MTRIRIRARKEIGIFEEVRRAIETLRSHNITPHDGEAQADASATIEVADSKRDTAIFILRRAGIRASTFDERSQPKGR
jgi:hypothetical protein